ncbi:hypothetical protein D3C80_1173000 [compost metagenome]
MGDNDGAADRNEQLGQFRDGGRPGVGGQYHVVGGYPALSGDQLHRASRLNVADRSVFINLDAGIDRHPAHAAHQRCRLHGGVAAFEHPRQVHGRAGAPGHFLA